MINRLFAYATYFWAWPSCLMRLSNVPALVLLSLLHRFLLSLSFTPLVRPALCHVIYVALSVPT